MVEAYSNVQAVDKSSLSQELRRRLGNELVNQPKRIVVESESKGVGGQTSASFGPGTGSILRRLTNYHNIWVLWMKPDASQTDVVWSDANIDADLFSMMVIACGQWTASNQTPYIFSSNMKSSRNMVANQELVISVFINGITAGNARLRAMLCASLSVK